MLSVIIPVYNEANTLLRLLELVQKERHEKEIIIVDDGSTDGTRELLRDLSESNIRVFYNDRNHGKGFCLRRGIAEATGDIVLIQDADLEYYPDEYASLIAKIEEGKADVVYGSRFLGAHRAFLFYHYLGNRFLNLIANMILNTNLTDLMTCYKAFRRPAVQSLHLQADGFGIETEITAEVFRRRYRVYEVPISYNGRSFDEGKKIRAADFFGCLYWLLRAVFRGVDAGTDTLLKMRVMKNNNGWTSRKIQPFLGKEVLEIGSGLGTFSSYLVGKGGRVTLMDRNPEYIRYLEERFGGNPRVTVVAGDAQSVDACVGQRKFDTVVLINVLEHIENDRLCIDRVRKILLPGGRLILIVPAHDRLYSEMDKNLGHYRRYERNRLIALLASEGYTLEKIHHMNFLSALGWYATFKIRKAGRMPLSMLRIGDMLIPATELLERKLTFPFGLSLFVVASAPAEE